MFHIVLWVLGSLVVGVVLGYAFRGKENKALVAASLAVKSGVGTVASDIQKKL